MIPANDLATPKPDQACCAHCRFSVVQQLPPPNLGKVRQCKRFPPIPIVVPARMGNQMGMNIASMWPQVDETSHCHEFEPAAAPAPLLATDH